MARTITEVSVEGLQKRKFPKKHVVYAIKVTWSDGTVNVIYRTYKQFQILEERLVSAFRGETKGKKSRHIPRLQGKDLGLSGSSYRKKWSWIDNFSMNLIDLPPSISDCDIVEEFFTPAPEDLTSSKLRKLEEKQAKTSKKTPRRRPHWRKRSAIKNISSPVLTEEYRVLEDYEHLYQKDITLSAGSIVHVIEKHDYGWWMVDSGGVVGWAPASYLEPVDGKREDRNTEEAAVGEGQMYCSVKSYKAQEGDELSFPVGVILQVIRKNLDGWWTAIYMGKEGFVPAIFLKPLSENKPSSKHRKKFIVARLASKHIRKGSSKEIKKKNVLQRVNSDEEPPQPNRPIPRIKRSVSFEDELEQVTQENKSDKQDKDIYGGKVTDMERSNISIENSALGSEIGKDDIKQLFPDNETSFDDQTNNQFHEEAVTDHQFRHEKELPKLPDIYEGSHVEEDQDTNFTTEANDFSELNGGHPENTPTTARKTKDYVGLASVVGPMNIIGENAEHDGTIVTKRAGNQTQQLCETEFLFQRCHSDATLNNSRNHVFKPLKVTSVDGRETSSSLPRSFTSCLERKTDYRMGSGNPLGMKEEAFLRSSPLLINSFSGLIPRRTSASLNNVVTSQKRKSPVLVGVIQNDSQSKTKQSCSINGSNLLQITDHIPAQNINKNVNKKSVLPNDFAKEPLYSANIGEQPDQSDLKTSTCLETGSDVVPVSGHSEKSSSLPRSPYEGRKRTRGSISKLLMTPKADGSNIEDSKTQLPEKELEMFIEHVEIKKQMPKVPNITSSKTVVNRFSNREYCEISGFHSLNSNENDEAVYTGDSPTTFSPPVLLSNNNTCLLQPGCPENSGDRFVFHPQTYFAIANYEADGDLEVSFHEGEEIKVIRKAHNGWWLVKVGEEKGWAPSNHLEPGPSNFPKIVSPEHEDKRNKSNSPHVDADMCTYNDGFRKNLQPGQENHTGNSMQDAVQIVRRGNDGFSLVRIPSMYGWIPNKQLVASSDAFHA